MKKFVLLFTAVAFSHSITFSQGCLPNRIEFTRQSQIDSFKINYPGCTQIDGDVIIWNRNDGSKDISNLNGLSQLTAFGGNVNIGPNPALISLTGLHNVKSIVGFMSIQHNNLLTDLKGLDNLTSVGYTVDINLNSALTSLKGLEKLASVGGDIWIWDNNSLTSIASLKNITTIGKNLWVFNNRALTGLSGLNNIASVGGEINLDNNKMLTSLKDLENLTSVGWGLQILNNDSLSDLTGLDKVTSVGGNLMISNNTGLTSLTGLDQLKSIGGMLMLDSNSNLTDLKGLANINPSSITDLFINHNNSLSTCDVESICNYLTNPGGIIDISENAPGCNSMEEVKAACKAVGVWSVGNWQPAVGSFPNPFSELINIEYTLEKYVTVNLSIFNLYGQEVKILVNEPQPSGAHQVQWNAGGLPEGIYFYRLQAGNQFSNGKIIKIQKQ